MTLGEVNEYLKENANEPRYKADKLTHCGYGQTAGGYHIEARNREGR